MRRLGKLIIALFFCSLNVYGQINSWEWQNPRPQGNDLRGLTCPGGGLILAAGDFGTMVRSTDYGRTWNTMPMSTTTDILSLTHVEGGPVFALGYSKSIIFGDTALILCSTDEGESWSTRFARWKCKLDVIGFFDGLSGIAAGHEAGGGLVIAFTSDGGVTWIEQPNTQRYQPSAISIPDSTTVIIATSDSVHRSTDRGMSWDASYTGEVLCGALCFRDGSTGYLAGYDYHETQGVVLRTTNGGRDWNTLQSFPGTYDLNGIAAPDDSSIIVAGRNWGEGGCFLRSNDGGGIWSIIHDTTLHFGYLCMKMLDALHGIGIGDGGRIMATTDGGHVWVERSAGTLKEDLTSISYYGANHGTATGNNGTILHTSDRGAHWILQSSPVKHRILAVSQVSETHAVAAGGYAGEPGFIIVTTDGGLGWQTALIDTEAGFYAMDFTSRTLGTVAGYAGDIRRTTDGGTTWHKQTIGTTRKLLGVDFRDDLHGIAVGDGVMASTTDGGVTWVLSGDSLAGDDLCAVSFADDTTAFAVGPGIENSPGNFVLLKTTDGGRTWGQCCFSIFMVESPQNIKFVTPEIGYICSYQGIGAMTTDGGESWSVLERAVDDLIFAMEVQDLNHITLVGEKGCIVSASIGGVAGVEPTGDQDPRVLHLLQNYPNPFNPETQIDYFQPAQGYVRLEVYDILGREIATLIDGLQPAGNHSVKWDASSVSGGIYFYRLQTAGHIEARKMILLK